MKRVGIMQGEVKFHSDLAMAEIERASRSIDFGAAQTHLRLSEHHLERVRALSRRTSR